MESLGFPFNKSFISQCSNNNIMPNCKKRIVQDISKRKRTKSIDVQKEKAQLDNELLVTDCFNPVIVNYERDINQEVFFNSNYTIIQNNRNKYQLLVICNPSAILYVSGICHVTLIKGIISLNGCILNKEKKQKIHSPNWQPAIRLYSTSKSFDKITISKDMKFNLLCKQNLENDYNLDSLTLNNNDSVFVIDGVFEKDLHWIEKIDDKSKYKSGNSSVSFNSGIIGTLESILDLNISAFTLPKSWVNTADYFLLNKETSKKVLICGNKGSGKSTYLRYLVNRFLHKYKSVMVIDCDSGQPEFTASCIISLSKIDKPILKPNYILLNDSNDVLNYFIGDITINNVPLYFIECVKLLNNKYMELSECNTLTHNLNNENPFELLDNYNSMDNSTPLIINCDGNIRFSGSEILASIIDILKPTDVVQLTSEKSKNLNSFDNIDLGSGRKHVIFSPKVNISTISSANLRSLRLIAYFLYHEKLCNKANIIISDAKLYDSSGCLCISLLSIPPYEIPFSRVSLRTIDKSYINPNFILASLNNSIVGICKSNSNNSILSRFINMRLNSQFNLDYINDDFIISDCVGLGIIRYIDIEKEILYLITPIDLNLMGDSKLVLFPGNNIIIPQTLTFIPDLPTQPYSTSEAFGDGSSAYREKPFVKRI